MATPKFDPTRYPRNYSPSLAWRSFLLLAAGAVAAGGLFGAWDFVTGHDLTSKSALGPGIVFMTLAALGGAAVVDILRSRVTLEATFVEMRGLRTHRVTRADIDEYSVFQHHNHIVE
jgi:hypothetical protein